MIKNFINIKNHDHSLFLKNYYLTNGCEIKKCLLCNKPFDLNNKQILYVTNEDNCDIRYFINSDDSDLIIIYDIIVKNNLDIFDFLLSKNNFNLQ